MKTWMIAFKDMLLRVRDRKALLLGLATPLILTAIIGEVFGKTLVPGEETLPASDILIVNDDTGAYGQQLVTWLTAPELVTWIRTDVVSDLTAARASAARGEVTAVVYIPAQFTAGIQNQLGGVAAEVPKLQILPDPADPVGVMVVEAVVAQTVATFNSAIIAGRVSADQARAYAGDTLLDSAALNAAIEAEIQAGLSTAGENIKLEQVWAGAPSSIQNPMSYLALSLAVFFLLFGMFDTITSILTEHQDGTFARLRTTETGISQILLGKMGGTLLMNALQLGLLIIATRLMFGLGWGRSILGLILMVTAITAAVTSLGTFLAAFVRDIQRAGMVAGAVALVSAALGGSFFTLEGFPDWLQTLSYLTINRWAIDGLVQLTIENLGWTDVLLEAVVLYGIAGVLFSLSVWRFPRNFVR